MSVAKSSEDIVRKVWAADVELYSSFSYWSSCSFLDSLSLFLLKAIELIVEAEEAEGVVKAV